MKSKQTPLQFIREFERFCRLWEEKAEFNPKDISEEFMVKLFKVYKEQVK